MVEERLKGIENEGRQISRLIEKNNFTNSKKGLGNGKITCFSRNRNSDKECLGNYGGMNNNGIFEDNEMGKVMTDIKCLANQNHVSPERFGKHVQWKHKNITNAWDSIGWSTYSHRRDTRNFEKTQKFFSGISIRKINKSGSVI